MATHLATRRHLTVVTNGIETARILARDAGKTVILTGGVLRQDGASSNGPIAERALEGLRITRAFLSCEACSVELGLMGSDLVEGNFKAQAVASAAEVVALVDAKRFEAVALSPFASTDEIGRLVTDDAVPERIVNGLRARGVDVTVCGERAVRSLASMHAAKERHTIGFANLSEEISFAVEVRRSLERAVKSRTDLDLILADNELDGDTARRVAQTLLERDVDLFIQFQIDEVANNQIMNQFQQHEVPVVAVDIPMVGAVYFGVDNFRAGHLAGTALGERIREHWNGRIDHLILLEERRAGSLPQARMQGQVQGLSETLGGLDGVERHVLDSGNTRDVARDNVREFLPSLAATGRIAVLCFNDEAALGALDAVIDAGLERNTLIVSQGADRSIRDELRRPHSPIVGATAYFPESYGERLLDLATKLIEGAAVPPAVYSEHLFIDATNVDEVYPED
jgi:ribose transport system substrate-binding protein